MAKHVLVFMANGFEDIELVSTVDILRRGSADVKTVSLGNDLSPVKSARNICMIPDICIDNADFDSCDLLVLPGGIEGTKNLGADKRVIKAIKEVYDRGKIVAAICAAPAVLAAAGIMKGKKATSHPAAAEYMKETAYIEANVAVDKNIVTSRGAGTSFDFAFLLLEKLLGSEAVEKVNRSMFYKSGY